MASELFLIDPTGRKRPMFNVTAAEAAQHLEFARENDAIAERLERSPGVARSVARIYRRAAREHRDCAAQRREEP